MFGIANASMFDIANGKSTDNEKVINPKNLGGMQWTSLTNAMYQEMIKSVYL